jgi:hypothetical protein
MTPERPRIKVWYSGGPVHQFSLVPRLWSFLSMSGPTRDSALGWQPRANGLAERCTAVLVRRYRERPCHCLATLAYGGAARRKVDGRGGRAGLVTPSPATVPAGILGASLSPTGQSWRRDRDRLSASCALGLVATSNASDSAAITRVVVTRGYYDTPDALQDGLRTSEWG